MARGKKKEGLSLEEKLEQALVPVDEQPYEVPENWCWVKVGGVCSFENGYAFKADKFCEKGTMPVIRISNIMQNEVNIDSCVYTTEKDVDSKFLAEHGDLLIAMSGATTGKNGIFLSNVPAYVNQRVGNIKVRDKNLLLPKYRNYYIMEKEQEILQGAYGGAQPNISGNKICDMNMPLPPLQEQQRIVERIESLFAKLDEVKEKVQEVKKDMATRKKAILYKAFSGELTKKWRRKQNIKSEVWNEVQLINVLKEKPRNGYSPKPVEYETPYKSMTLSATTSGVFKPEYFKFIDEHIEENSYLWLKPGDILIQRANSLEKVGTSAIYNGGKHEFIYPDLMMKLQVIDGVSPEFIAFQLKTERVMNYIRNNATGTAGNMPKINQKVVSEIPIVLPSREEQKEIVRILKLMDDKEFQIYTLQEKVLEELEVIRKSILKKAFRGKLGTNNPDEESAIELLKAVLMES